MRVYCILTKFDSNLLACCNENVPFLSDSFLHHLLTFMRNSRFKSIQNTTNVTEICWTIAMKMSLFYSLLPHLLLIFAVSLPHTKLVFWPVIQLIDHLLTSRPTPFCPTVHRCKKCSDILKVRFLHLWSVGQKGFFVGF